MNLSWVPIQNKIKWHIISNIGQFIIAREIEKGEWIVIDHISRQLGVLASQKPMGF